MKVTILLAIALTVVGCCGANPVNPVNPANPPQIQAAPVCDVPQVMAAPEDVARCGQLPPEARPGEVWCCVEYSIPSAPQRVCVQPESERQVPIPAIYETRSEQVMVAPARTEWRRVPCETSGSNECWSLVDIPAQYESRCEQVLVQPESYRIERVPAVFEEVFAAPVTGYRWERFKECETPAVP